MSILDSLQKASFKGVYFLFKSSSTTVGRKSKTYEYPDQSRRYVIDLGKLKPTFKITGSIYGTGADYFDNKKALADAISSEGAGKLVHPTEGTFTAFANPTTYTESIDELNQATFSLEFEVTDEISYPVVTDSAKSTVNNKQPEVIDNTKSDFSDSWSVIDQAQGVIDKATGYVNELNTKFKTVANKITTTASKVSPLLNGITDLETNVVQQVLSADTLINSITAQFDHLFNATQPLFSDASLSMQSFYKFNSGESLPVTTVARNLAMQNRAVLNQSVNAVALSYDFLATTQTVFADEESITAQSEILNEQFNYIMNNNVYTNILNNKVRLLSKNTIDVLEILRTQTHQYLRDQTNSAKKVDTVNIKNDSLIPLTYRYYGNLEMKETLANLNKTGDPALIKGDFKILTS